MNFIHHTHRLIARTVFAWLASCTVIANGFADPANWATYPGQAPAGTFGKSAPQGQWILMESKFTKAADGDNGYWKSSASGASGSVGFTTRGAGNEYSRTTATWSAPPPRPKAGETVMLDLRAKVDALTNRASSPIVLDAYIDVPGLPLGHRTGGAQRLATTEGGQSCESHTGSASCRVSGALPSGSSENNKLSLYVSAYNDGLLAMTEYVYGWLAAPPPRTNSGVDSGTRFNSLSGTVEIADSLEDAKAGRWYFARLETVLEKDMVIRTGEESGCILSFLGGTIYVMGPETEIILNAPKSHSPWSIAAGKLWQNVKNMATHGFMELEMSQAAMSIKGTTLVAEETGSTSTLKVIQGSVEFRPKRGGAAKLVTGGNMISATARGADAVRRFDVAAESHYWDSLTEAIRNGRLRGKQAKSPARPADGASSGSELGAPANLALKKPTRQSSTIEGAPGARAVDGNRDGNFFAGSVTHTDNTANAWWEVDLGGVKRIDRIRIWNRTDCCGERLSNFHVLVSARPFDDRLLSVLLGDSSIAKRHVMSIPGQETSVPLAAQGRYVRIQLAGQNWLSIAEVEVMGGAASSQAGQTPSPGAGASAPSLLGTWGWTCCRGAHRGTFSITEQNPDGSLRGAFGNSPADLATPLQGTFSGGILQFTRYLDIGGRVETQQWRARIEERGGAPQTVGGRWSGYAATPENDDFQAGRYTR